MVSCQVTTSVSKDCKMKMCLEILSLIGKALGLLQTFISTWLTHFLCLALYWYYNLSEP